jgi:hypothetical protein
MIEKIAMIVTMIAPLFTKTALSTSEAAKG